MPNPKSLALIVSEISAFIRTDVILIKNIYTLWGRKRDLLPVVTGESLILACKYVLESLFSTYNLIFNKAKESLYRVFTRYNLLLTCP